ncbi:DNA-binding protein BIN4 [Raphanus sativus]|uniref:DNA-binding protein BIN4 n=1 Tax=Raphanus sativus TaxID=3726 RepID=A0A6J0NFC2_RAPSA|nr:DNA-binding protein BIN4 [Raphanus sativus]KAJ4900501.1 DNA-binding protein BIN4 [Raphanus sativus]
MSSSSREGSPDWLRSFQAPTTTSLLSLSSSDDSPCRESETISSLPVTGDGDAVVTILDKESSESLSKKDSKTKLVTKQVSIEQVFSRRKKKVDASLDLEEKESGNEVDGEENSSKQKDAKEGDDYVWFVSSDSEPPSSEPVSQQVTMATVKDEDIVIQPKEGEPAVKKAQKKKSPKKKANSDRQSPKKEDSAQEILKTEDKDTDATVAEEVKKDKNVKPSSGSSSRLPLVLSEKVNRTKVLVECEGDSIDLSGDMGAVGRVVVSDTTEDVYLDLKGTIYKSTIVPSRTFCIVNVGQSEAKIEAIMNDFIQLTPQSNVYEAETMMEGTLEGFSFDSDDESNKNGKTASKPADQSGSAAEVTNANGKGKAKAKGENVVGKKRGRPTKEKQQPAKKARSSAPKKTKPKK